MKIDTTFMKLAIEEANFAQNRGEVPVGAVIINSEKQIIARSGNRVRELKDPTAHAEILAIRSACNNLKSQNLNNCSIFVTLEPCSMCASAIAFSRIKTLAYGATDKKSGGIENGCCVYSHSQTHHKPEVFSGFCEEEINRIMKNFFERIRSRKSKYLIT